MLDINTVEQTMEQYYIAFNKNINELEKIAQEKDDYAENNKGTSMTGKSFYVYEALTNQIIKLKEKASEIATLLDAYIDENLPKLNEYYDYALSIREDELALNTLNVISSADLYKKEIASYVKVAAKEEDNSEPNL